MVEAPGVEPGASLAAQGLPGISGYIRDTAKINRGLSPITLPYSVMFSLEVFHHQSVESDGKAHYPEPLPQRS